MCLAILSIIIMLDRRSLGCWSAAKRNVHFTLIRLVSVRRWRCANTRRFGLSASMRRSIWDTSCLSRVRPPEMCERWSDLIHRHSRRRAWQARSARSGFVVWPRVADADLPTGVPRRGRRHQSAPSRATHVGYSRAVGEKLRPGDGDQLRVLLPMPLTGRHEAQTRSERARRNRKSPHVFVRLNILGGGGGRGGSHRGVCARWSQNGSAAPAGILLSIRTLLTFGSHNDDTVGGMQRAFVCVVHAHPQRSRRNPRRLRCGTSFATIAEHGH